MGDPVDPARSLLPAGLQLELFVTLTDFYGYQQFIQIHDPALIREREHRHVLRFAYRRSQSGEVESDFGRDNAAGLAFAARATSAYPGAFPPAQIREVDRVIAASGRDWPRRAAFIQANFQRYHRAGLDPLATSFIDGSVLNNKPFAEALKAIHTRPAYRHVDRRLVYIDPDPVQPLTAAERARARLLHHAQRSACRISRATSRSQTNWASSPISTNASDGCGRSWIRRGRKSLGW